MENDERPDVLADEKPAEEPKPNEAPEGQKPEGATETETDTEGEEKTGDEEQSADDAPDDDRPKRRLSGSERWKRRAQTAEAELAVQKSRRGSDGADIAKLVQAEIGNPPQEKDYPEYFAFERAQTAYEVDKRMVERDVRRRITDADHRQAQAQQEAALEYAERCGDYRKDLTDFDEVMRKADGSGLQVSQTVESLIVESDKGPLIAYHLAKNPDRVRSLNAMSERQAAKEIGRLEGRLSLPAKKTTQAPPPVSPLKGGAAPQKDPSKMTIAEYRVWREAGGKA